MTLSVTLVKSRWVNGNLQFLSNDGNVIFEIDGANEIFHFPGGRDRLELPAACVGTPTIDDDAVVSTHILDGAVIDSKLDNPHTYDTGYPGQVVINVSGVTTDAETVTIDDDIFVVRILATDTTDDAAGEDFNNTDDPLTIDDAVTTYANVTFEEGDLIRLDNEVMEIINIAGNDVTLKRAVSGTTAASHANGTDIFQHATPASPAADQVFVGVATTAADVFTAAITGDINHPTRTQGSFYAMNPEDAEVVAVTADDSGGNIVANDAAITVANTGTNIDIESKAGILPETKLVSHRNYVVQAQEAALGDIRIAFPFDVAGFVLNVYDAAGVPKTLTSEITINGALIEIDDTGATNLADTDVVSVIAWA